VSGSRITTCIQVATCLVSFRASRSYPQRWSIQGYSETWRWRLQPFVARPPPGVRCRAPSAPVVRCSRRWSGWERVVWRNQNNKKLRRVIHRVPSMLGRLKRRQLEFWCSWRMRFKLIGSKYDGHTPVSHVFAIPFLDSLSIASRGPAWRLLVFDGESSP